MAFGIVERDNRKTDRPTDDDQLSKSDQVSIFSSSSSPSLVVAGVCVWRYAIYLFN